MDRSSDLVSSPICRGLTIMIFFPLPFLYQIVSVKVCCDLLMFPADLEPKEQGPLIHRRPAQRNEHAPRVDVPLP